MVGKGEIAHHVFKCHPLPTRTNAWEGFKKESLDLDYIACIISATKDYFLSLNKKDAAGQSDETLRSCDIVSGDILYIITNEDESSPAKRQNMDDEKEPVKKTVAQSRDERDSHREEAQISTSDKSQDNSSSKVSLDDEKTKENFANRAPSSGVNSIDTVGENHLNCEMNSENPEHMDTDCEDIVDQHVVNQCLSEPVLCREASLGCVPALLREMVVNMKPEDETESVCVVLHVLMLETGFLLQKPGACCSDKWRYPGHYKFVYTYTGCTNIQCLVTVIPTGLTLTIHGKIVGFDSVTRQCSVKVTDFIQGDISDCEKCYNNLAKLSRIFKDCIAIPLVQDIRTAAGLEDTYGILALTQEIKLRILSFLDVRSLLKIALVCQELNDASQDTYLWRRLYLKDFGNRRDNSLSQNWKSLYRQEYKIRKERRKMMGRFTMVTPPTWGPQNPFSGPSNWIPPGPGMIGGDYDLYPNFPGSLPGVPGRLGPRPPTLPRPRYDLIGPSPDLDPNPDMGLLPRRPSNGRPSGMRNPFSGFGPRFF